MNTPFNSSDASNAADGGGQEPKSMSLGGIARGNEVTEAEQLELDAAAKAPGKSMSQGMLLIALVVLVAGGVLYAMRLGQGDLGDGASQQVEARVEAALAKLTQPETMRDDDPLAHQNLQALFDDTDAIVAMFAADHTERQVPIDYVQKNPFAMNEAPREVVEPTERSGPSDEELRAARRVELEREIQSMRLQSVMGGRTPIAIVNGEFMRVGQTVGSFEVASISPDTLTVVLEHDGERFTLSMQE